MEAHVGLEHAHVGIADGEDEGGEELRGGVIDLGDSGRVDGALEGVEVDAGEVAFESADGLEVVDLVGVALLGDAEAGFGELGFKLQDGLGVVAGLVGRAAGEGEHFGDVGDILLADFDVFGAGAEVVVPFRGDRGRPGRSRRSAWRRL